MIRTIRRYISYTMLNSCTCQVSYEFTLKITDHPDILFLPIENYRGDLRIINSDGKDMILLSDMEFENTYNTPISKYREVYLSKLHAGLPVVQGKQPTKQLELTKNHRLIAVLLERKEKSYYEKITMTWVERIENRKRNKISQYVEIPIHIHRYGLESGISSAIYLSVKIAEKYEVDGELNFVDLISKKTIESQEILKDPIHQIYRLTEISGIQIVRTIIKISVPRRFVNWIESGLIASIVIPAVIIMLITEKHIVPVFTFESLAGVIGFLVGERLILLTELSLLKYWDILHMIAVIWCGALILSLMILIGYGYLTIPQHIIL